MRLMFILLLAFMVSIAGCGGDEYTDTPTGDGGTDPGSGDQTDEPDKPKRVPMSELAKQVMGDYRNVKAIPDDAQAKTRAVERVAKYEGQSLPADASLYLGLLYRYTEEWGKAAAEFQKFVRGYHDPNHRDIKTAMYYTVTTLVKDEQFDEATRHLTAYSAKYPDEAQYIKAMASSIANGYVEAGKFEDAIPQLDKATEMGDKYAGEEQVRCLWATGKYDAARTKAAAYQEKFDGSGEGERYSTLNTLAQKMGKPAREITVAGWSTEDPYDVSQLNGKVYLVFQWSPRNRGSANKIWRVMKDINNKYSGEPFAIVGLSQPCGYDVAEGASREGMSTEDEVYNLKVWANPENYVTPWPLGLMTDESLAKDYGYRGKVPSIALVGKKGKLRYFRDTSDEDGFEILKKVIEILLDE